MVTADPEVRSNSLFPYIGLYTFHLDEWRLNYPLIREEAKLPPLYPRIVTPAPGGGPTTLQSGKRPNSLLSTQEWSQSPLGEAQLPSNRRRGQSPSPLPRNGHSRPKGSPCQLPSSIGGFHVTQISLIITQVKNKIFYHSIY